MQLKQFKESYSGVNLIDVCIEVMLYTCSVHLCMSSSSSVFGKGIAIFLLTLPVLSLHISITSMISLLLLYKEERPFCWLMVGLVFHAFWTVYGAPFLSVVLGLSSTSV